jgi:hypothetical protein
MGQLIQKLIFLGLETGSSFVHFHHFYIRTTVAYLNNKKPKFPKTKLANFPKATSIIQCTNKKSRK